MVITDASMAWRLYIIWARDWRIAIFPCLLVVGLATCSTAVFAYGIYLTIYGIVDVYYIPYQNWALASIVMTLVYNVLVTGLIVGRLWWAHHELRKHASSSATRPKGRGDYVSIIIALTESGTLYTLTMIGYIIANYVGDVRTLCFTERQNTDYEVVCRETRSTCSRTPFPVSSVLFPQLYSW